MFSVGKAEKITISIRHSRIILIDELTERVAVQGRQVNAQILLKIPPTDFHQYYPSPQVMKWLCYHGHRLA